MEIGGPSILFPFPNWVPQEIIDGYSKKGVNGLFQWQSDVIAGAEADSQRNLVFSAPTSAGKSIVAELIGLKVALTGKRVLFVLPYISVAKEKLTFIQRLWRFVDVQVAGFIGANSAPSRDWTAAVCTMERANSLINHAIMDGTLEQYGLIVLDELHMIADSSRGGTLESLATKILHYNASRHESSAPFRIVAMSATIPNLEKVGTWLDAKVEQTDFRPISLTECLSCEGIVRDLRTNRELRRLANRFHYPGDADGTIGFSVEAVTQKKQTLVFCSSKNEVEKIAFEVARVLSAEYKSNEELSILIEQHKESHWAMKTELEQTCRQLDPILAKTLPRGVAYHHAGLTSEERECIEKAFRDGQIFVLVATSTLSSGVNLPANRVIIKAQIRGPASLQSTSYRQMAGRAGRLGHTDSGESIVVCRSCDVEQVKKLINQPLDRGSSIVRDPSKLILEGICSGLTPSMSAVSDLTSRLLYPVGKPTEQVVCQLAGNSLVTRTERTQLLNEDVALTATQLGRAALASSLPPDAALFVFADLQTAAKALAIDTELHMLYLVTPANCTVWQGCDWNHLYSIFRQLDGDSKRVAKLVGANERFLLARLQGKSILPSDRQLQVHLRFFSALTLFDIVNEQSLGDVADKYRISRGALQTLQQQSATYAVMVVAFCGRLGWQYLKSLLDGFAARLAFGIRAELTELVRVDGIDGSRARVFHEHDITSLSQLAQSTVKDVATVLSLAVPFESSNANDGLCEWLSGEERLSLQDAAKCLIMRANEAVRERIRQLGFDIGADMLLAADKVKVDSQSPQTQMSQNVGRTDISQSSCSSTQPMEVGSSVPGLGGGCATPSNSANCVASDSERMTATIDESLRRRSVAVSTPLSDRAAPRPSLSCSIFEDGSTHEHSMDLFSNSLLELTLDDREDVLSAAGSSADESVVNCSVVMDPDETGEILDLESSLLNMARGEERVLEHVETDGDAEKERDERVLEHVERDGDAEKENNNVFVDSFNISCRMIEPTKEAPQKAPERRGSAINILEDSFNVSCRMLPQKTSSALLKSTQRSLTATRLSFGASPRHSSPLARVVANNQETVCKTPSIVSSPINTSIDLFDSPASTSSELLAAKRLHQSSQFWSPSVSSPVGKHSRLSATTQPAARGFHVNDVCANESRWSAFVARSCEWRETALALVTSGSSREGNSRVLAAVFCTHGGQPDFVPLTEEYFPGTSSEESLCPSSTPSQNVPISARIDQLARILRNATIYFYDALRQCEQLRADLGLEVSTPVCVSYLSFLGMLRAGDNPLPLAQLAAKFEWDHDMSALLRMNARVKTAAQAFIVCRLFDRLRSQAVRLSSEHSVQLEIDSIKVVNAMSTGGFPFRSAVCSSALSSIRGRMNELETECRQLAGRNFNLDSASQVSEVLFTRLRLPHPGGNQPASSRHLATNKTILKQMSPLHPIVDKILLFRKLKHAVSQCLVPLSLCVHSGDVIRTTFEMCTATGRLLSHHPNIQNVPKGDLLDGFCVRSLFTAREGYLLLAADYCQLELRVLAHLSNDPLLLRRLADDARDFFSDLSLEWGFSRDSVKQLCYGIIYGMGVRSLAEATKTSMEQAQTLMNTFFRTFPKVRSYINSTKDKAATDGYVCTMLGRRRRTCTRGRQEERAHDDRQSVNFTIQGTASEIFKKAIVDIDGRIRDLDARIVMTVHDEVIVECHRAHTSQVEEIVGDAMQRVFPAMRVPLRVKVHKGPNWGQLE